MFLKLNFLSTYYSMNQLIVSATVAVTIYRWYPFAFHIIPFQYHCLSVPWSLPRSGWTGNPPVILHLVAQGISGGSPALQDLFLYSSTGSGDTTNRKDFEVLYFQHKPHFLSTWLGPNRAAGLRSNWFNGKLVLKTNHAEDETRFPPYLEGELGDVRELVTFK